ncbi:MAG: hypothetical protein LV481_05445, partial [Methylacidiphilales bacterium]|nr:hypothetical protein [Candidatus Methylacidiphilales bacterium]
MSSATSLTAIDPRKGLIVLGLALLTLGACWLVPPEQPGNDTGVVMNLPDRVGPLKAVPEKVSQAELAILPSDTTFARNTYGYPT